MSVGGQVYGYLRTAPGLRLSPAQAAGIVGNTQQESGNDPNAPGGGLDQGQGARAHGGSLAQQLAAIRAELLGPERGTLAALRATHTPQEAARVFSQRFERPGVPMLSNRERYALQALREYGHGALAHVAAAEQLSGGGGGGGAAGGGEGAGVAPAAITALIASLKGPQQSPVAGVSLPKPSAEPDVAARAPRELAQPQPQVPPEVLSLLSSLGSSEGASRSEAGPGTAARSTATPALPGSEPKGLTDFGGKQVAAWIAPALEYARAHGWKGSVTSGYRSFAEQQRIYDSGVRPAAKPGTSNHEGSEYPRGAVDVSEAQQLAAILKGSPYAGKLVWAGAKDPVHFSHPHGGSY